MKWTMISLAAAGAVVYALIFIGHLQNGRGSADIEISQDGVATASAGDFDRAEGQLEETVIADATLGPLAVSHQADPDAGDDVVAMVGPQPEAPRWEGDPWPVAVAAFERGEMELAADALEAAVEAKENSPYRHYLLALTQRRLGEPEAAVQEFTRSLELSPDNPRALVNLGRAYLDLEDTAQARQAIDLALEKDLQDTDTWNVLGRIELSEGHLPAAEAAFSKAVGLDPQNAWAQNNLGYARILQERFEDAIEPLRLATSSSREEAIFYNNLGVALERSERLGPASLAYSKADDLGHATAEVSYERVAQIIVAHGEQPPSLDDLDASMQQVLLALAGPTPNPTEDETETESEPIAQK